MVDPFSPKSTEIYCSVMGQHLPLQVLHLAPQSFGPIDSSPSGPIKLENQTESACPAVIGVLVLPLCLI